MKVAYSSYGFSGLVLCSALSALFLLMLTNDLCPSDTHVRCGDGKCIFKRRFCNGVIDCLDGSDETDLQCSDVAGIGNLIGIHFKINRVRGPCLEIPRKEKKNLTIVPLTDIPEGCNSFGKEAGIVCRYQKWTFIPWDKFDAKASRLQFTATLVMDELNIPDEKNPLLATIRYVYLEHNDIRKIGDGSFCTMQCAKRLNLMNNSIEEIGPNAFCEKDFLTLLDLSNNNLKLEDYVFRQMPQLHTLNLKYNLIKQITEHVFRDLKSLGILDLRGNEITFIHIRAFRYNLELTDLNLEDNKLTSLDPDIFAGQGALQGLYLGRNKLRNLPNIFKPLQSLTSLGLAGIELDSNDYDTLLIPKKLDFVSFTTYSSCKYVPKITRCFPITDGSWDVENLLAGLPLRFMVWLIGIYVVAANIWIIILRVPKRRKQTSVLDIFVNNLAVADCLKGVYLIILAVKDIEYRNAYNLHAYQWNDSTLCMGIGMITLISTEVSVFILALMSAERLVVVKKPFKLDRILSKTQARILLAVVWVVVFGLAILPVFIWSGETSYYGSTGLCFPMHLDEVFSIGWEYTTFVFIGINSFCLGVMCCSYIIIYQDISQSRKKSTNPANTVDFEMTVRIAFTVATNICCIFPIILAKVFAFGNYLLPQEYISWMLLCVLPLNSALNPLLYTFSVSEIRVRMLSFFTVTSSKRLSSSRHFTFRAFRSRTVSPPYRPGIQETPRSSQASNQIPDHHAGPSRLTILGYIPRLSPTIEVANTPVEMAVEVEIASGSNYTAEDQIDGLNINDETDSIKSRAAAGSIDSDYNLDLDVVHDDSSSDDTYNYRDLAFTFCQSLDIESEDEFVFVQPSTSSAGNTPVRRRRTLVRIPPTRIARNRSTPIPIGRILPRHLTPPHNSPTCTCLDGRPPPRYTPNPTNVLGSSQDWP